ncbi:MAG: hypothetical protein Q8P20_00955 [bacterium]|nr:hypothetical protein [bacterium]
MIKIKKANCEDGPKISQLLKSKYHFKTIDEAQEVYNTEIVSQHYRMAYDNDDVVGLISWRIQGTIQHGVAELTRITVSEKIKDPILVEEMLFDVMIAEADYYYKQHGLKLRKVYSLIHADNRQVRDFFENKGMTQEAILKHHFHTGQDEVVFSLFFS